MDFLKEAVSGGPAIDLKTLAVRLGAAFAMGFLAVGIYTFACRKAERKADTSFLATLVLLSLLICLVTVVIGDNVARAFSLVGTLAIVRFRTVVEDTRDTAFVIYAVACGMCAGSDYYIGPVVAAPLVLFSAWLFAGRRKKGPKPPPGRLVLRLASAMKSEAALKTVLDQRLPAHQLIGMSTARGGSAWDATYAVEFPAPDQVTPLVAALSAVDGVQGVELSNED